MAAPVAYENEREWECESVWGPFADWGDGKSRTWAYVPPADLLLRYPDAVNVCAPMVRYSKHAFRTLVSLYNTQITTTPMILAPEFSRSALARDSDFSTSDFERGFFAFERERARRKRRPAHCTPVQKQYEGSNYNGSQDGYTDEIKDEREYVRGSLICQMAANEPKSLADAAELVAPYIDGIDLNCGCPQPWAFSEGIGSALLRQPERVRDLVRGVKARLGEGFCMSVKIRVDPDLQHTDQLVRTALHAGASILTVHGRTRHQASDAHPADLDAIRFALDTARACGSQTAAPSSVPAGHTCAGSGESGDGNDGLVLTSLYDGGGAGGAVPLVANGDVWTLADAHETRRRTGAHGIMSARGLLANPALFAGHDTTPLEAIREFAILSSALGGMPSQNIHRHLAYMLESRLRRNELVAFNSLSSTAGVLDYLSGEGFLGAHPSPDPWATGLPSPDLSWSSSVVAQRTSRA